MKKYYKIFLTVLSVPVILFVGVIGFLKFADLNNYKPDIEKLVRKYAKIDMKINGNIEIGVSLKPSLELNDVYVSDIDGNTKIARIGNALVQVAILPLLHKEVVVEKVQTENTEIFYSEEESFVINDLDAKADGYDSPVDIAFDTTVAGIDIFGSMKIDSLKELNSNNFDKSNIKADVKAMGYDLHYDGAISGLQSDIKTSGNYELLYKESKISGFVDFSMEGEVPYVKIDINGENINIDDFNNKKQASNSWFISDAYAEEYIPNTEIPYDYLRMVNADITIDVKKIKVDEKITVSDIKGNISLKDGVLKSNIQNLKYKNNVINGAAEITSPKTLPYIKLNIKGDGFDINDFNSEKKNEKRSSINFDWFISSAQASTLENKNFKIPYEYFKMINADINIRLKNITDKKDMTLSDVVVGANLKNGVLKGNIENITAGGGKIKGSLLLNSGNKTLAVYLNGSDIVAQDFYKPLSRKDNDYIYIKNGGKTSFDIDISTFGSSTDDYLSNADGQVIAFIDDSIINIKSLKKLQGNFLMQILDALKIKTSDGDMNLSCAVVRGDLTKGVVDFPKGIAFNADTFYLVANGKINLQNDKINLDLQPFSGKITDVNISSILGNLIKITGTINNPKIGINQTATAKNVIGAIASGGAYNVGDLLLSADSAPCHTALLKTKYESYFKADKSVSGTVSKGYNNTKDTIADLGKGIKNQTKGLKNNAKDIKKQIKGLFK